MIKILTSLQIVQGNKGHKGHLTKNLDLQIKLSPIKKKNYSESKYTPKYLKVVYRVLQTNKEKSSTIVGKY